MQMMDTGNKNTTDALPPSLVTSLHQAQENTIMTTSSNSSLSSPTLNTYIGENCKLAVVLVGLPARGKTFISRKLARYLSWMGYHTRVFNVGNYRRRNCGAMQPHHFFDPTNEEANKVRTEVAMLALDDMLNWFSKEKGCIGIYDATNSAVERRQVIHNKCAASGIQVMFVESICNDPDIILSNVREVKVSSPDYVGVDPEQAAEDFLQRIRHYEAAYETIDDGENHLSYIKLVDVGSRVIMNRIKGYLQSKIIYYLMNLHITPRSIYLSRHGESQFNVLGNIGGDSDLSPRGRLFASKLPSLLKTTAGDTQLTVWTSTLKRTIQTSEHLSYPKIAWKALDELDSGVCDGMTYEQIAELYPDDFASRDKDKFNYRYKGGESYRDLVHRLEPIIMELERHNDPSPIFIIGHQAVLRAIYAYFMNFNHEELPYIKIPLHTVIKLTPKAYGCVEERFSLDVPAVDTHRAKPGSSTTNSASSSPERSKEAIEKSKEMEREKEKLEKLVLSKLGGVDKSNEDMVVFSPEVGGNKPFARK